MNLSWRGSWIASAPCWERWSISTGWIHFYEQSDAEARYNSTLLALIALIEAESLRQPIIMFVEDVQFIDEDSLNFLPRLKRALLASAGFYPVAIIATSRILSRNPLLEAGIVDEQLHLSGLPREAVARLVEILLGGVPALDLVNLVMDRSEGNPYFVEQIIRYLQDENLIEMSGLGWKQGGDVSTRHSCRAISVQYWWRDSTSFPVRSGRSFKPPQSLDVNSFSMCLLR